MRVDVESVVRTRNRFAELRRMAIDLARRIAARPGVAGVVLLGGLADGGARRFADEVSDIDLCVVLDLPRIPEGVLALRGAAFSDAVQPYLPDWLPNFKFSVPRAHSTIGQSVDVDVHQLIYQYERQPDLRWDLAKLEAYASTSEILCDSGGRVAAMVGGKIEAHRHLLRDRVIASIPVRIGVDVDRCIARGLVSHAHHVMNAAWADLLAALYLVNGEFPPNPKWALVSLSALARVPADCRARLEHGMRVENFSSSAARRRQTLLVALHRDLEGICRALDWFPADPYTHAATRLFVDRQLRHHTAADALARPVSEQYAKMAIPAWNRRNLLLDDA
jgi:hypothetical protein